MGRRARRRETSEDLIWKPLEEACPGCRTLFHTPNELLSAAPGSREKGQGRDRLIKAGQGQCGPPVKTAVDRGGPSDPLNHILASRPELRVDRPLKHWDHLSFCVCTSRQPRLESIVVRPQHRETAVLLGAGLRLCCRRRWEQ